MTPRLAVALGGLALSLSLAGCTQRGAVVPKSSGSIGVSLDDTRLFVVDADHDTLTVIDTASRQVVGQVAVGRQPERVLVAPSGAVYVSSRGARTVSRVSADGLRVEATATVGAEPVGLALMGDGKRLLVANSMSGTLSVLDATTLEARSEVAVGGQPWALAPLLDGKTVYVTDFTAGTVRVLNLDTGAVTSTVTLEQPPEAECKFGTPPARTPAQTADVILSPDGERAYVAHVQSRTGLQSSLGPTNSRMPTPQSSLAFAVAPALSTLDTLGATPFREQRQGDSSLPPPTERFPAALLATNMDQNCQMVGRGAGMDAPSSLVVDGLGEWVFVADHNSNAVAVVSATRREDERFRVPDRGIADVVRVGARPTGIAVAGDLRHAWVHNALDYSVSFIENVDGHLAVTQEVFYGRSTLTPEVERGRRLFYSAVDPRVTQPELGGVSCSSCHPDGRADGLSWVLPAGPLSWVLPGDPKSVTRLGPGEQRNTPALWGVTATAPYHWDGSSTDLSAFSTGMVAQMGGGGLARRDVQDLSSYMDTIKLPDNPSAGALAAGLLGRGQALFQDRCGSCHAGAALTDGKAHVAEHTDLPMLDTPSLRGAFATRPYLHDGSAPELSDVLRAAMPSIRQHDQGTLSSADFQALEAFVAAQ